MIARTLTCLLFPLLLVNAVVAQRNCATLDHWEYVLKKHTNTTQNRALIERHTRDFVKTPTLRDGNNIVIPVVVNVIYKDLSENISDAQILEQIRVLNEDFGRLNPDADAAWPQAASTGIQFQLAKRAPDGTPSNGIRRKYTSYSTFSTYDDVKFNKSGGLDAWPTQHYLNIWVCKIQPTTIFGLEVGQILGFAFPPDGLSHWPDDSSAPTAGEDGVVIDFRAFSSINPNPIENPTDGSTLNMKGRTPVHEVGHYLGLRHIWGDGGLFGPNDCAQSDGVDDTPFANAQSEFDCDKTKNSCEQVELFYNEDPLDLVENYMDYSSEECMNMFTKGQVEIMRGVLMGPRAGLLSSVSTHQPASVLQSSLAPNPANDRALLRFQLPEAREVSIQVLSADGRRVIDLHAQQYGSGLQQVSLDTRHLATGMYLVQVQSGATVEVKKLAVQR